MHVAPDLFAHADRASPPGDVPREVAELFEKLALEIRAAGYERYSADAILHRIRWHHRIEKRNREFVANDHWTAPLARWFLARHPDCEGFFELRERRTS